MRDENWFADAYDAHFAAVVKGRSRRRAVCSVGVGSNVRVIFPPVIVWPINQTSDAGHSQRVFSAVGQNDVPAHRQERTPQPAGSGSTRRDSR
ncbi:MAG: hypothetical protein ACRDJ9_14060 [Dehalococcoidia bacterium]